MGTEQSEFPQTAKGCFFMCQRTRPSCSLCSTAHLPPHFQSRKQGEQSVQGHRWSLNSGPESQKAPVPRARDTERRVARHMERVAEDTSRQ